MSCFYNITSQALIDIAAHGHDTSYDILYQLLQNTDHQINIPFFCDDSAEQRINREILCAQMISTRNMNNDRALPEHKESESESACHTNEELLPNEDNPEKEIQAIISALKTDTGMTLFKKSGSQFNTPEELYAKMEPDFFVTDQFHPGNS